MNDLIKKIIFFDRTSLILVVAIVVTLICNATAYMYITDLEESNRQLLPEISRMESIAKEARELKHIVTSKEKKISSKKSGGAVPTLERILKNLGLKAKAIKPLDKKKSEGIMEEKVDLQIVNTDLNTIVNLIYIIENSPSPLKISSASIRTEFESPEKFILELSVSLMSKG